MRTPTRTAAPTQRQNQVREVELAFAIAPFLAGAPRAPGAVNMRYDLYDRPFRHFDISTTLMAERAITCSRRPFTCQMCHKPMASQLPTLLPFVQIPYKHGIVG